MIQRLLVSYLRRRGWIVFWLDEAAHGEFLAQAIGAAIERDKLKAEIAAVTDDRDAEREKLAQVRKAILAALPCDALGCGKYTINLRQALALIESKEGKR